MNPELKLGQLENSILRLLNVASSFIAEASIEDEEELIKILRKIMISRVLYEKNVVAVSGLQGVGKSTIIKNLYDLDDNMLPILAGRGEKIPVLITEYPCEKPEPYALILRQTEEQHYDIVEEEISWDDFSNLAKGQEQKAMMVGIRVPYRHFNNSFTSFMLLPGFEGNEGDYFESLIDHAMTCANTIIIALNESKVADGYNLRKITELQDEYKGAKPIFALTFSDQSSDGNKELKDTLIDKFAIEDPSRVVPVGAYSSSENSIWARELMEAVERYASSVGAFRSKQLKTLKNLIRRDLAGIIRRMKEELSLSDKIRESKEVNKILSVFDKETDKIRKEYHKQLKLSFSDLQRETNTKIRGMVLSTPLRTQLKHAIFKKTFDDNIKMGEAFGNLIEVENAKFSGETVFAQKNIEAISALASGKLGIYYKDGEDGSLRLLRTGEHDIVTLKLKEGVLPKMNYLLEEKEMQDLITLSSHDSEVEEFTGKDLSSAVKLIPVFSTMNLGLTYSFYERKSDVMPLHKRDDDGLDWGTAAKPPISITNVISTLAGVDMADGESNIAQSIANTLGITLGNTAGMAITGGLMGIGVVTHIIHQVDNNKYSDYREYEEAFKALREIQEVNYMEVFDDYMEMVRERFEKRLKEIHNIRDLDTRVDNLYLAVARVEKNMEEMGELINDSTRLLAISL